MIVFYHNNCLVHLQILSNRESTVAAPISSYTASNVVISPNFLVWRFCGKAQFLRIARNYAETVPFRKISTPGN